MATRHTFYSQVARYQVGEEERPFVSDEIRKLFLTPKTSWYWILDKIDDSWPIRKQQQQQQQQKNEIDSTK